VGDPSAAQWLEFGGFRLDRKRRLLTRVVDGQPVRLPPRTLDTLEYLLERPGELVRKSALIDALWPTSTVEENSLDRNISLLRRALGEKPRDHLFIATVPGRRYRFVAAVKSVVPEATEPELSSRMGTKSAAAYQLYVQALARNLYPTEESIRASLELLTGATRLDPQFAAAWSLLAITLVLCVTWDYAVPNALAVADDAARRALAIDPRAGAPHTALGLVHALRAEWLEAERHMSAADSMQNDAYLNGMRHMVTMAVGHLSRAKKNLLRVHQTGLAEPFAAQTLAFLQLAFGDVGGARRYLEDATALGSPRNVSPYPDIAALIDLREGRHDAAAERMAAALTHEGSGVDLVRAIEGAYTALHRGTGAATAVAALLDAEMKLRRQRLTQITRNRLLLYYTLLGAVDAAHDVAAWCLDAYAKQGMVGCVWFVIWLPEMRPFRQHPRFQSLASRMKLTDYWRDYGPADDDGRS
jgi:DNA-binding winged helix-turn-helix (wHTH) protein